MRHICCVSVGLRVSEVQVVKLKRKGEGGRGKGSRGQEGVKRVTKGSGQEGVNFSGAGLGL